MPEDEFDQLVQQKASEFFEEACVKPLKRATESKHGSIPHMAVSSKASIFWLSYVDDPIQRNRHINRLWPTLSKHLRNT
jgi:hypothetical protein